MRLLWTIAVAFPLLFPVVTAAQTPQVIGAQTRMPPRDSSTEKVGKSVIRGKITSGDTGRPLRRAQIRISAPELTEARTASTNTQGIYEIRDLPAARYTITVMRSGYLPMQYGQRRPGESAKPLQVAEAQTVERVDFVMPRAGVVSGRVIDETGEAFEGVTVWVMRVQYFRGRRRLVPTGPNARTDDTGQYRVLAVTPGDYVILARIRETWTAEGDVKEVLSYLPTYYPGTGNAAEAQRVKVGTGQEVGAIDIPMVAGRAPTISGTALRSDGMPMSGSVTLMEEMSNGSFMTMSMTANTKVGPDGTWRLKDVSPGEYRVEASAAADGARPAESASTIVTIASADLDGIALVADPGGTVAGRVETDDGSPVPGAILKTRVGARAVGDPGWRSYSGDSGRIDAEGNFELTGVRGPSLIQLNPPLGWAIKSLDIGGRDYVDAPIEVRGGRRIDGARIVLTNKFPALSGRIVDARGNPADGTVILFPSDASKWIENSGAARGSRPDQSGTFRFQSVRPGEYLAIALDYVQTWQLNDPEFLADLRDRATKLALGEESIGDLTLTVRK